VALMKRNLGGGAKKKRGETKSPLSSSGGVKLYITKHGGDYSGEKKIKEKKKEKSFRGKKKKVPDGKG